MYIKKIRVSINKRYIRTVGEITKEELEKWMKDIDRKQRQIETKKRIELLKLKMNNNGKE